MLCDCDGVYANFGNLWILFALGHLSLPTLMPVSVGAENKEAFSRNFGS